MIAVNGGYSDVSRKWVRLKNGWIMKGKAKKLQKKKFLALNVERIKNKQNLKVYESLNLINTYP